MSASALAAPFLLDGHRRELEVASSIDSSVILERGYESVPRPSPGDPHRIPERLKRLGIPSWAYSEPTYYAGLLIPIYSPVGERVSVQWKPARPAVARDGKRQRYASPTGKSNRLDVHPRNRSAIVDPTIPLWITEGIKKGDALTSRGLCAISLTGVFNWRSTTGTLPDWEDVMLRGRQVVVCFDADTREKPNVKRAMIRLGKWLESKGAERVHYLVVPGEVGGAAVKGVDDYFAAGGTLDSLRGSSTSRPPEPDAPDAAFTDSRMAERLADEVLSGSFVWAGGLGWLSWDGVRWRSCTDVSVGEAVRQYCADQSATALAAYAKDPDRKPAVDGWHTMLSANRQRAVLALARGIVEADPGTFDADPDILNTYSGIVDLRTGELRDHDPAALCTKVAGAAYDPGAAHPDWNAVLSAVPADLHEWFQVTVGQAVTGHMTPDDLLLICQGGGENGKSSVFTAISRAFGDYYTLVSDRVLLSAGKDVGGTEVTELRGARLALMEETPEARRLDPQALKKTVGTETITARRLYENAITWSPTHTLVITTNHIPVVTDSDHATWRRLALVRFPFTFRKPGIPLAAVTDRRGDPGLRARVKGDPEVLAAVLAWAVAGARRWYDADRVLPPLPERVVADVEGWRAESDPVLGFTRDHLVFDSDGAVLAAELADAVNAHLQGSGHREWSATTVAARFEQHAELVAHGVVRRKARRPDRVSRPPSALAPLPAGVARYWFGIRFRELADDDAEMPAAAPAAPAGTEPPAPAPAPPAAALAVLPAPLEAVLESAAAWSPAPCPDCDGELEAVPPLLLWTACRSCTPGSFPPRP